jgi:hypothetical protein
VLRERVPLPRALAALPLDDFFADDDLPEPPLRDAPELDDFALLVPDLLPLPVERDAVDRDVDDFARDPDDLDRDPVDFRAAPAARDELDDEPELAELPELALPPASIDHLPLITRCAASATASAISEPSFVALAITFVAACEAVSAASRPASRIARRAFGLALIAAAAAARPAASISLLIAAFASLSTVSLLLFEEEPREDEPEELLRADLAMLRLLRSRKDTSRL